VGERELGGREGDTMSERGRGIHSEGERRVDAIKRGRNIGREGEGRRKRVREDLSIKFTFFMFKEDIFRDQVTILNFVNPD
jgi:hypothetical protein